MSRFGRLSGRACIIACTGKTQSGGECNQPQYVSSPLFMVVRRPPHLLLSRMFILIASHAELFDKPRLASPEAGRAGVNTFQRVGRWRARDSRDMGRIRPAGIGPSFLEAGCWLLYPCREGSNAQRRRAVRICRRTTEFRPDRLPRKTFWRPPANHQIEAALELLRSPSTRRPDSRLEVPFVIES